MNYQFANAIDFATDELFVQWVVSPTSESDSFWHDWLLQHPSKRGEVEEARRLVSLLAADTPESHSESVDEVWLQLQNAIHAPGDAEDQDMVHLASGSWWQGRGVQSMAAAVVLLLLSAATLFWLRKEPVVCATGFGEKLTVLLPDSSKVVLNGNSTLTYTNYWPGFSAREVYLTGEAFFDVVHKEPVQKFIVHTADDAEVEVFGTEFNVRSRNNGSQVVLSSGKVQLTYRQKGQAKQVNMKPGELIAVSGNTGITERKWVNPGLYTAWKDNRVIFDNTSLREIAQMLEQVYGYKVVVETEELARQKLTANLNGQELDKILLTVSATLDAKITKQEELKTILISNL